MKTYLCHEVMHCDGNEYGCPVLVVAKDDDDAYEVYRKANDLKQGDCYMFEDGCGNPVELSIDKELKSKVEIRVLKKYLPVFGGERRSA